jgi:hypothetical protein
VTATLICLIPSDEFTPESHAPTAVTALGVVTGVERRIARQRGEHVRIF